MTIVLDVSFDHQPQCSGSSNNDSQRSAIKEVGNKKGKDKQRNNGNSSKAALKVAKVKTKVSHAGTFYAYVRVNYDVWLNVMLLIDFRIDFPHIKNARESRMNKIDVYCKFPLLMWFF